MQPYPPAPPQQRPGMSGCAIAGIALGVLGFVAVCAVCAGMFFFGRARQQASAQRPAQPPLVVDAATLIAEYHANEVRANGAYQGQLLELSGRIEKIATDLAGRPELILAAGHPLRRVQCHFGPSDQERFATLKKGQFARVRGVCRGLFVHVQLDGCMLLAVDDQEP